MANAAGTVTHLTADQLAERWATPVWAIYRLVREKKIPTLRLGRRVRFRIVDVERFEEKQVAKAK